MKKQQNPANKQTYEDNIVAIVRGEGTITSPSANTVKINLITPKTIFAFENSYLGNQHQSFLSLAREHDVSPATVTCYKKIYLDLRERKVLTQGDVENYLWNYGFEYPLPELTGFEEVSNSQKIDTLLQNQTELIELQRSNCRDNMKIETKLFALDNTKIEQSISVMADVLKRLAEGQRDIIDEIVKLQGTTIKLSAKHNLIPSSALTIAHSVIELVNSTNKFINTVLPLHKYYLNMSRKCNDREEFQRYYNQYNESVVNLVYDSIEDIHLYLSNMETYTRKILSNIRNDGTIES